MTEKQIALEARRIAGCLFDDAEGTLADRLRQALDAEPLGTDGDFTDADREGLAVLLRLTVRAADPSVGLDH